MVSVASLVWLSGNILSLSSSTGVNLLSLPDLVSTTCLKRDAPEPPSPVTIVLDALSRASGNVTGPSEYLYLWPVLVTLSAFLGPLR